MLGLCGGYQMLGRAVIDEGGIEGEPGETAGLGLLDVVTRMTPAKRLERVAARHLATGRGVEGYEMHIGVTEGPDRARPVLEIEGPDGPRPEGAASADGRIAGTYVHGLFAQDGFRAAWLEGFGAAASGLSYGAEVEATLDALADHLEAHLDVDAMLEIAGAR